MTSAFNVKHNLRHLFIRPHGNFPALDGMRALSMLLVIVFHSFTLYSALAPDFSTLEMIDISNTWQAWVWNADKGVDVFFVISGFLVTGLLLKDIHRTGSISLGQFYWRRFLRLSPAFYFVLFIYWLANGPNADNILYNVFYINNFLPHEEQAMNWSWSLAIEEQYYLVFPMLFALLLSRSQRPLYWLWFAMLSSFVIRAVVILSDDTIRTAPVSELARDIEYHGHFFSTVYDNLYTRYGALLAGVLAAYYHFQRPDVLTALFSSWRGLVLTGVSLLLAVGFLLFPMVSSRWDDYHTLGLLYQITSRNLFALGIAGLVLASIHGRHIAAVMKILLGNRFWYPLAQLSYSMYLVHIIPVLIIGNVVVQGMASANPTLHVGHFEASGLIFFASTVASFLLAMLIYLFIERPLMNLRGQSAPRTTNTATDNDLFRNTHRVS